MTTFESEWTSPFAATESFGPEVALRSLPGVDGPRGSSGTGGGSLVVTVRGSRQGQFKGDTASGQKLKANWVSYSVTSPRDVATGQASGRRQHQPVVFEHEVGGATPQFLEACTKNEVITEATFEFLGIDASGQEEVRYSIRITDATVSGVRLLAPAVQGGVLHAEVAMTFRRIEQESKVGRTMTVDDWRSV